MRKNMLTIFGTVVALTLGGCGTSATGGSSNTVAVAPATTDAKLPPLRGPRRVVWVMADCYSFQQYLPQYEPDMLAVAERVAAAKGKLLMTCTDGQPLTTTRIMSVDFGMAPPGVTDPDLISRINRARAAGLDPTIKSIIRQQKTVAGSGQLEGLEVAGRPNVAAIYYWTDAEVREAHGGFDIRRATDSAINAETSLWSPRLLGLKGVTVTIIGAGKGAQNAAEVRQSRQLFEGLIEDSDGGHLRWVQSLGQL